MKTVGERIKDRRNELGMTQTDLANKLGVTKTSVCHVETTEKNLTVSTIRKYATALNTTLASLMGFDMTTEESEPNNKNTIGIRIRNRREELHMSQTELAAVIGESKQNLYKYETGKITNIPYEKVSQIATALRTTESYLYGWIENPNPPYTQTTKAIDALVNVCDAFMPPKDTEQGIKIRQEFIVRVAKAILPTWDDKEL